MAAEFCYSVFGIKLHSDLEFPELMTADFGGFDAILKFGPIPTDIPEASIRVDHGHIWKGGALLEHSSIGKLYVTEGKLIAEPVKGYEERDLRAFVLGPGIGALLYSMSRVPLHISALESNGYLIGITGPSGAGKSTLAYCFRKKRSLSVFTDDVATIDPMSNNRCFSVHAGPPRIKLWDDALDELGISSEGLLRDVSRTNKFHLTLSGAHASESKPLKHLILLKSIGHSDKRKILTLTGADAFRASVNAVYRPSYMKICPDQALILKSSSLLANSVKIHEFERSKRFEFLDRDMDMILQAIDS